MKASSLKEIKLPGKLHLPHITNYQGIGSEFYSQKRNETITALDLANNKVTTKDSKHIDFIRLISHVTSQLFELIE